MTYDLPILQDRTLKVCRAAEPFFVTLLGPATCLASVVPSVGEVREWAFDGHAGGGPDCWGAVQESPVDPRGLCP